MHKNMPKYGIIVLIIMLASITGCIQKSEKVGYGTLVIKITDAPGLVVTDVMVNITQISVHSGNESDGKWFDVVNESKVVNLSVIRNVQEILGTTELPAGHYTQIRLYVESALATINGSIYHLTIPSKTIKLVKEFEIKPNETTTLLLDFNLEKSIHMADGKFIMKPEIKIIQE